MYGQKNTSCWGIGFCNYFKSNYKLSTSVNLASLGEAWTIAKKHNLDLKKTFDGIKISSGNSFVHETEVKLFSMAHII